MFELSDKHIYARIGVPECPFKSEHSLDVAAEPHHSLRRPLSRSCYSSNKVNTVGRQQIRLKDGREPAHSGIRCRDVVG
jgi:hypothetical protein